MDADVYWESVQSSPAFHMARSLPSQRDEIAVDRADQRSFSVGLNDTMSVSISDDGMDMRLRLARECPARPSRRDKLDQFDGLERLSAFLLSHPDPPQSAWALACVVGGLDASEIARWPPDAGADGPAQPRSDGGDDERGPLWLAQDREHAADLHRALAWSVVPPGSSGWTDGCRSPTAVPTSRVGHSTST